MTEIELIDSRVTILHNLIYGSENLSQIGSIDNRIKGLLSKIEQLEFEVPNLKACRESIKRLGPLLLQKRLSLQETADKAQIILSSKDQLLKSLRYLREVQDLVDVVNKPFMQEIPQFLRRLDIVENTLRIVERDINRQTEDLDELISIFETTMGVYAEKVADWDRALKLVEDFH